MTNRRLDNIIAKAKAYLRQCPEPSAPGRFAQSGKKEKCMKRLYQAVLAERSFFRSRNLAICVLYTAMAAFVLYLSDSTNAIYIRDGENISLEFTLMDEPEDLP